jgi:hypothetical protein
LAWSVLAGVGKVETDHGRNVAVSSAGALGPMQFMPATWRAYGLDGDGDGRADVMNAADAVHGAAGYLCANGGGQLPTLRDAIWAYNHADWYVDLVLEHAARYASAAGTAAVTGDAAALLADPRLLLTSRARADLEAGVVDARVVDMLATGLQRHTIGVSVLRSGHTKYVAGSSSVSNHWCGQAADIFLVDGQPVTAVNGAARALALETLALAGPSRPAEFGSPWGDLPEPGTFTDAAHADHLHVGYGPRCLG